MFGFIALISLKEEVFVHNTHFAKRRVLDP